MRRDRRESPPGCGGFHVHGTSQIYQGELLPEAYRLSESFWNYRSSLLLLVDSDWWSKAGVWSTQHITLVFHRSIASSIVSLAVVGSVNWGKKQKMQSDISIIHRDECLADITKARHEAPKILLILKVKNCGHVKL